MPKVLHQMFFSTFKNVNPGIFCRRQLFEVIFANELTENSVELLDGIRKISEKKEINTNVTFITRDEVCEFVKTVEEYNDDFEHPPQFLDNLQRLCSNITGCLVENDEISRKQLALILKHKLINKMYTQYAADAKYDYQMCLQEESLRKLQKAEISKQARFSMLNLDNILSVPEMKPKRPLKKTENPLELKLNDYMSYPLPDNFTGSDDLRDHVLFYVFTGFQDPCLLKLLIRYQVPISCILQVSKNEDVRDSRLNYFWKKLMDMSENKEKYHILEDVAQMKYIYEGLFPDREEVTENFYRERLKELEDILMNILHLKRKHLNYIRNIFPFQAEETELRFNNFSFYEAEFEGISAEYITIPFITTSMVKEVEQVLKNNATKDCTLGQSTLEHHCPLEFHNRTNLKPAKKTDKKEKCPFSFEYFKKPIVPKPIVRKRIFKKFYDGDILNMLLVKDKENERMVHSNYEILSKQKLLDITYRFKNLITNEPEVPHFHNQSTPSAKMKLSDDQTNHFLNLLYFTSMTKVKRISPRERSKRYLCNLSDIFASNDFLPKSISHLSNSNLYENFEGMLYRWIEPLTKCTLVQWLYKAQQEFSSNKFRYCDSTRTLLVYFHHNLSPAGTRTRIWNESLRTLTCFRDFCNYYIFEDEKWLSKNPPVKHMRYENYKRNEENYIFQRLLESDNSYDEYKQYLIPYYYCDNFDFQDKLCCAEKDRVKKFAYVPPLVKPNLEEIISELKSYPSKGEIANKCAKTRTSECLLAYDKIPQRFGLIGATNEFFSHDGLKVSVDTCRFHFENFKMKVSLEFNGHTLFGHSQKKRIESHIVLCNGVIITIINPSTHVDNETDSCPCSEDMEQLKSSFSFRQNTALGINQSQEKMKNLYGESFKISNISLRKSEEKYVLPLNSENMNKIHFSPKVLKDRMRKSACKKRIAIITNILRELQIAEECYKYSDYGRYKHKYLYKNQAAYKIPYSSMIKRFLREPLKQKSAPIYRRSIFLKKMIPTKNDDAFNIKICFPNGLILESIPSRIRSTEYTIKQAHMNREKYMDIAKENFRLFFNHGIILISFYNGNMRILDAQGTIVEFKHKDKSQSTLNNHKCLRNMNTCRKVIYRLMKEANKREFSIYGRSRRNHISVSESLRINNKLMKTLNKTDIPFSDIKLFSSDGYLYKIKDDSVKKKKFTRILEKHNFISGDTIWERTDHAKILFGMNGDQIVLFPDGTKISKTIQVLPDLKFFNKRDKDGWTVIINNYLYEHPVYYPVECNNQSKTTLVDLKDGIKPELSRRNCSVIFPNNTNLCFDSHHIDFTKLCPTCKAKCTCSIKIHVENRYEHERFLACNDSYNKEFISDFKGRCKINTDYLQGELNRSNCNHFQRNDYQKSFLIHEDLSGDLLWNDKMVLREIENIQRHSEEHHNSAKLEEFTTSDGSMTEVKFFKNYYTNFDDKYLWSNYLHPFSPSESSSSSSEEVPVYQIGRSIFNILQEQETEHLSNIVKKFLNEENSTKLSL